MRHNYDIKIYNNDIVISNGDIEYTNDVNAYSEIINNRIKIFKDIFTDSIDNYLLSKVDYIGLENSREIGELIEEEVRKILMDIADFDDSISIETVVLPYDNSTIMIKIFLTDNKSNLNISRSYIYSLKDGVTDVYQ